MLRYLLCLSGIFTFATAQAQQPLTVEKIMQDPKWIGTSPSNIFWSADSKTVYFLWNPENAASDSLYSASLQKSVPLKVNRQERLLLPTGDIQFGRSQARAVFEKYGDIYLTDLAARKTTQITNTLILEFSPIFSADEKKIFFTSDQNLYSWEVSTGKFSQLTDFRKGKKTSPAALTDQEKWLKQDQLRSFDVLRERDARQTLTNKMRKKESPKRPKEFYLDERNADMIRISPNEKFITFRLTKSARPKNTIVPNYVTASGFTEDINGRTKVGAGSNTQELCLYDVHQDTVYQISLKDLPGINDKPVFGKMAASETKEDGKEKKPESRLVSFSQLNWSEDGTRAVVAVRASDNKDRWIVVLDPVTRKFSVQERLHDDAWVSNSTGWSFSNPH